MNEEIAPIPRDALPPVLQVLKEKILLDPDIAVSYLRENPIAVVALSKAKTELSKMEKSINEEYNFKSFLKKMDELANQLLSFEHVIEKEGLALSTEFILEIWRKYNQKLKIHTMNQQLLKNLLEIHTQSELLENTSENRVIREIVFDSLKRISDLENHEKQRAEDNWSVLTTPLKEIIEKSFQIIPQKGIPRIWKAWLGLATLNNNNAEEYRKGIASLVLEQLSILFYDLDEPLKYEIAPWIISLEKIVGKKSDQLTGK